MPVTGEAVTLVLTTIDRSKAILDGLEKLEQEAAGNDADLIGSPRWPARRMKRGPIAI
jgi:two-component system, chemotaxis family, sensor kinase CheA